MEKKDTLEQEQEQEQDLTLSRTPSPAEQKIQEIDEEFKCTRRELDSIHQDLGTIMSDIMESVNQEETAKQTKEPTMQLELESAIFTFDSSSGSSGSSGSSDESGDDSMTDSLFTADTSANQALLDAQAECIAINNEGLQTQYDQMLQNQAYLQQQEHANNCNQALATQLQERIHELYATHHQLQQQVYYHRQELDRLAEQAITYEGVIQRHQKTIEEQEIQIEQNHKLLAYDKQMVGSLGYVFRTQPYANQIASLAVMNSEQ
jgi:hypothetical protein